MRLDVLNFILLLFCNSLSNKSNLFDNRTINQTPKEFSNYKRRYFCFQNKKWECVNASAETRQENRRNNRSWLDSEDRRRLKRAENKTNKTSKKNRRRLKSSTKSHLHLIRNQHRFQIIHQLLWTLGLKYVIEELE